MSSEIEARRLIEEAREIRRRPADPELFEPGSLALLVRLMLELLLEEVSVRPGDESYVAFVARSLAALISEAEDLAATRH